MEEEAVHLMVNRKQRKGKRLGTRNNPQRHAPSVLLPPAKPHLFFSFFFYYSYVHTRLGSKTPPSKVFRNSQNSTNI
jgi:hypothetical protein